MTPNRKPAGKSFDNDTNRYVYINKLNNKLFNENPYTMVYLKDEVMGIIKDNILDLIKRSDARAKLVSNIGANFTIGVFIYSRQGTLGNWYAVWKMEHIQDD